MAFPLARMATLACQGESCRNSGRRLRRLSLTGGRKMKGEGRQGCAVSPFAACSLQGGSVDRPRVGALQFARIVDEQTGLQHGVVGQAVEVGFGNADFA